MKIRFNTVQLLFLAGMSFYFSGCLTAEVYTESSPQSGSASVPSGSSPVACNGTNSYASVPTSYNDVMDRIRAMRLKDPCRGHINLTGVDFNQVWGVDAVKDRVILKYYGFASEDDYAIAQGYSSFQAMMEYVSFYALNQSSLNFVFHETLMALGDLTDPYDFNVLSWDNVDVTGATFPDGLYLSNVDLSGTTGLTTELLNRVSSMVSVKLPAGFDMTQFQPSSYLMMYGIQHIDFSNTTHLTLGKLQDFLINNDYNMLFFMNKLPSTVDFTGVTQLQNSLMPINCNYLSSSDLEHVTGLTAELIDQSPGYFAGAKLPVMSIAGLQNTCPLEFDLERVTDSHVTIANLVNSHCDSWQSLAGLPSGFNLSLINPVFDLSWLDLSQAIGLTVAHLNGSQNFPKKIPANFNLSGLNTSGKELTDMDLSTSTNLTATMLNQATKINSLQLPSMNLSGFNPTGKDIYNIDFSKTTGLTVAMLNSASQFLYGIKLPPGFNLAGLNTTAKLIAQIDFSNTVNLTVSMLNSASNTLEGIKLPVGFHLSGFNPTGKSLVGTDFSGTTGLTVAMLNSASIIQGVKLPAGMDVTGLTQPRLALIDFNGISGLTVEMLNSSTLICGIKLPVMDISGLTPTGGIIFDLKDADFSNATGVSSLSNELRTLLVVQGVRGITVPNAGVIDVSTIHPSGGGFTSGPIAYSRHFSNFDFSSYSTVIGYDYR